MFDETNIHQLRSATVVDRDGSKVGNVQQVYLDDTTGRPSWVTVNTGLFGTRAKALQQPQQHQQRRRPQADAVVGGQQADRRRCPAR